MEKKKNSFVSSEREGDMQVTLWSDGTRSICKSFKGEDGKWNNIYSYDMRDLEKLYIAIGRLLEQEKHIPSAVYSEPEMPVVVDYDDDDIPF